MEARAFEERAQTSGKLERIVVVGTSGSGKSTLARQLGELLGIPAIEMDALFWNQYWTPTPLSAFRERVTLALDTDAWVVDGNYSKVRDLTWERADTLVWLDYSLWVVMSRLLRRTLTRIISKEELWSGNRESITNSFFRKDSILLWALQTHQKNRNTYTDLIRQPIYKHLNIVRLRSPRATRAWLAELRKLALVERQ